MYSPSTNHNWCTPIECGPEQSKNEIRRGFSGTETSNSSIPAGVIPSPGSPSPFGPSVW